MHRLLLVVRLDVAETCSWNCQVTVKKFIMIFIMHRFSAKKTKFGRSIALLSDIICAVHHVDYMHVHNGFPLCRLCALP